jgi:uncharacterized protein
MTPFDLMCKPSGPDCNLGCRYCFYAGKRALFASETPCRMSDEVLEAYVRGYIAANPAPEIHFNWQGGEPTLMGVDFFRRAVKLQHRFSDGRPIRNSLQTNGILLDDAWCGFFASEAFLVGLSLDGPRDLHNRYRVDRRGGPTFDRVMSAITRLRVHGVQYNTLTCVTAESSERPLDVYRFLREHGSPFLQFIPIVEREPGARTRRLGLRLAAPGAGPESGELKMMRGSVEPEAYGRFLTAVFDEWVRHDVGRVFVQLFDVSLAAWSGVEPPLCTFGKTCGKALVVEHNGDVYACDHFVYPDYRIGNILRDDIRDLASDLRLQRFGNNKQQGLPRQCRDCDVMFACNGGCPKNRFARANSGEGNLNYLCPGYRMFFRHADPAMSEMADLLRRGLPPARIMERRPGPEFTAPNRPSAPAGRTGRNAPCPCGSGRKRKHCCG